MERAGSDVARMMIPRVLHFGVQYSIVVSGVEYSAMSVKCYSLEIMLSVSCP